MITMTFVSEHKLKFEVAGWIFPEFMQYRIGTCSGLWRVTDTTYDILAITNHSPGNGHFGDVMEWFENSCRRDNRDLQVLELWNKDLWRHLIEKRGFEDIGDATVIKKFRT